MSLFGYDIDDDMLIGDEVGAPLSTLETLLRGFMLTHGNLVASLPKRAPMKRMAAETYLDGEFCPPGTAPCLDDDCPEEGLNIFTASGEECYDNAVVRTARTARVNELKKRSKKQPQIRDNRQMLVAVRELSEIVKAAAVLSSRIQGIGHANVACSGVDALSPDAEKKRAFCGTLTTDKGERRCKFDDAAKTCSPIAGVAQPSGAAVPVAAAAAAAAAPSGPTPEELAAQEAAREARRQEIAQKRELLLEGHAEAYQEATLELKAEEDSLKKEFPSLDKDNFKDYSDAASYALNLMKKSADDLDKDVTDTSADVKGKQTDAQSAVDQSRTSLTNAQAQIASTVAVLKSRGENPLAGGEGEPSDSELEALRKDALLQVTLFQGYVQSALNELPQQVDHLTSTAAHELALKANEHGASLKEQFDHLQVTSQLYIQETSKSTNKQLKDEEKANLQAIANAAANLSRGEMQVYPKLINLSKSLVKSETAQLLSGLKKSLESAATVEEKSDRLNAVVSLYKAKFFDLMIRLQAKFDAVTTMYEEQLADALLKLAPENVGNLSAEDKSYFEVVATISPAIIANLKRKQGKINTFVSAPLPGEFAENLKQVEELIKAAQQKGEGSTLAQKAVKLLQFGGVATVLYIGITAAAASFGFAGGAGISPVSLFLMLKQSGMSQYLLHAYEGVKANVAFFAQPQNIAAVIQQGTSAAASTAAQVGQQAASLAQPQNVAAVVQQAYTTTTAAASDVVVNAADKLLTVSGLNVPSGADFVAAQTNLAGSAAAAAPAVQTAWAQFLSYLQTGADTAMQFLQSLDPTTAALVLGAAISVGSIAWAAQSYYKKKKGDNSKKAPLIVVKGDTIDTNASLNNMVDAFTKSISKLQSVYDHVSLMSSITDKTSLKLQSELEGKKIFYALNAKKHPKRDFKLKNLNAAELALLSLNPSETLKGYDVPCSDFNTVFKGDVETQGRVCRTAFRQGDQEGGVDKCAYSVEEDAGKDKDIQPNRCYDAADYNTKTTYASSGDSYRGSSYSTYAYLKDDLNKILADIEGYELEPEDVLALQAIKARLELYEKNKVPFRLSAEEFELWARILGVAGSGHYTARDKRFPAKFK